MTFGELGERLGHPFVQINGIERAAFNECGHHRPVVFPGPKPPPRPNQKSVEGLTMLGAD